MKPLFLAVVVTAGVAAVFLLGVITAVLGDAIALLPRLGDGELGSSALRTICKYPI